ncbi:MAG: hypothetical protein CL981_00225 [Euryarchaeota archaeon]|nr:hypothetical protein [Euryarchaeota archaeon]|tara:strand:+ start:1363 stop:1623 length:261 start_codon:yes stop_codon:yes gene_type:complete
MLKLIFKGLVVGNLLALNAIVYMGYRTFSGGLDLLKSEIALQMEERLKEEYDFIQKDLKGLESNLLESQKELIPETATVESGLPIF